MWGRADASDELVVFDPSDFRRQNSVSFSPTYAAKQASRAGVLGNRRAVFNIHRGAVGARAAVEICNAHRLRHGLMPW